VCQVCSVVTVRTAQAKRTVQAAQSHTVCILLFTATSSATLGSIQSVLKGSISGDVCEGNERQKMRELVL